MKKMPPQKRAVFLDRDGTVNVWREGYLDDAEGFKLIPGTAPAIKKLNYLGFLVVVVTNQSGIARGLLTHERLESIHARMHGRIRRSGGVIHAVYYCPHHPDDKCACRKPELGMIKKACREWHIDPHASFFVGDSTGDIKTGERAGMTTILVKTGYGGGDGRHEARPDFVARDLKNAVQIIEAKICGPSPKNRKSGRR